MRVAACVCVFPCALFPRSIFASLTRRASLAAVLGIARLLQFGLARDGRRRPVSCSVRLHVSCGCCVSRACAILGLSKGDGMEGDRVRSFGLGGARRQVLGVFRGALGGAHGRGRALGGHSLRAAEFEL